MASVGGASFVIQNYRLSARPRRARRLRGVSLSSRINETNCGNEQLTFWPVENFVSATQPQRRRCRGRAESWVLFNDTRTLPARTKDIFANPFYC